MSNQKLLATGGIVVGALYLFSMAWGLIQNGFTSGKTWLLVCRGLLFLVATLAVISIRRFWR